MVNDEYSGDEGLEEMWVLERERERETVGEAKEVSFGFPRFLQQENWAPLKEGWLMLEVEYFWIAFFLSLLAQFLCESHVFSAVKAITTIFISDYDFDYEYDYLACELAVTIVNEVSAK